MNLINMKIAAAWILEQGGTTSFEKFYARFDADICTEAQKLMRELQELNWVELSWISSNLTTVKVSLTAAGIHAAEEYLRMLK